MPHPLEKFVFFGSSTFSKVVLDELKSANYLPTLVVTLPSKPSGRKHEIKDTDAKIWAEKQNIDFIRPAKFDEETKQKLRKIEAEVFIVASYGKIIPADVLKMAALGSFNIHPSILPKYRGPSPIQSQILSDEKETGVTVIRMDEMVDHGPILSQTKLPMPESATFLALGRTLFEIGTRLLTESLLKLSKGQIELMDQNDHAATLTRKFNSADGLIDLGAPMEAWRRYRALSETQGVYFIQKSAKRDFRVKVAAAKMENGLFVPVKVIPEARKEMPYEDFKRGIM